jgi:hypothetical protein
MLADAPPGNAAAGGKEPSRTPPWAHAERDRDTLRLCDELMGRWLVQPPSSAWTMRASKFERRVMDALAAVGVPGERLTREIVLPIGVDRAVRRFLDDPQSGSFQRTSSVSLRLDLAWVQQPEEQAARAAGTAAGQPTLMVVEVDGSHHSATSHFFTAAAPVASRSARRDALKSRLLAAAGPRVRFLRLGAEFERDSHQARTRMLKALIAFVRPGLAASMGIAAGAGAAGDGAAGAAGDGAAGAAATNPWPAVPLPDPAWAARVRRWMTAPQRFRRSASAPPDLPRPAPPISLRRANDEEALRKVRTVYNRLSKERAKARLVAHPEALRRELERIKRRQAASDSRKRPRDDAGGFYEPKWFSEAYKQLLRA